MLVVLFVTFWALVSIKLVLFIVLVLFTFLFVLLVSYSRLSLLQDRIFFNRLFDTGTTDLIMNNLNQRSHTQCDFLTFLVFASVMTEAACDIEAFERERARTLAGVMLQRARVIGRQRFRQSRPSNSLSCLRDSISSATIRCERLSHAFAHVAKAWSRHRHIVVTFTRKRYCQIFVFFKHTQRYQMVHT